MPRKTTSVWGASFPILAQHVGLCHDVGHCLSWLKWYEYEAQGMVLHVVTGLRGG